MFSYLHGMRPNARRTTSSQVHSSHQPVSLNNLQGGPEYTSRYYSSASSPSSLAFDAGQTSTVSSVPPSLPPIPRVASQYGPPENLGSKLSDDRSDDRDNTRFQGPEAFKLYKASQQGAARQIPSKAEGPASFAGAPEAVQAFTQFYHTPQHQRLSTEQVEHHDVRRQPRRLYTEPGPDRLFVNTESELVNTQYDSIRYHQPPSFNQAQYGTNTTSTQTRPSKPKLNRLNPMSILSRRRTAQTPTQLNDNASLPARPPSSRSTLPDDYDPRIRGKVVHDFSAPRPARQKTSSDLASTDSRHKQYHNQSYQDDGKGDVPFGSNSRLPPRVSAQGYSSDSQSSPERQHTPVFKENFGEELEPWRFDSSDRRNQLTTGLLERMPLVAGGTSALPPFARNFPPDPKTMIHPPAVEQPKSTTPEPQVLLEIHSTTSPPKSRSRATSITDPLFQSAGLPKHLKSNASRFSFDLAGVGSAAQEKLLEDKHRQKNARRAHESTVSGISNVASSTGGVDEDDEFIYDDMDFGDDLEEKIPGVNADADEESSFDYDGGYHTPNVVSPANTDSVANAINNGFYLQDSRGGFTAGVHDDGSRCSLASQQQHHLGPRQAVEDINASMTCNKTSVDAQAFDGRLVFKPPMNPYEDDLYFDDGLIDDFEETETRSFDESVFDDETSRVYGLPLRDLKPLPILAESPTAETSQQSTRPISAESAQVHYHAHPEAKEDADRKSMPPPATLPVRKSSLVSKGEVSALNFNRSAGLTQDNLAAYHSALALAADRAAREGRFDRKPSIDDGNPQQQPAEGRKLRVSFDESQASKPFEALPAMNSANEPESFDFDDSLEDDAIIAAANAEALENDEEGFYGQEFGFFAHANGSGEAEYANGGYFGPVGYDGVKRSHSGKANFQEPSLTPITERSEWSQRNSMISLAVQGAAFPPSQQTPGLAQLADAMQYEDESMSLSALLKLRRGAFGGSNGSLQSLGSQRSGSPQRYNAQASVGLLNNGLGGSQLAGGSTFSLVSSNGVASDDEHPPGSPTLTLQTQGLVFSPPGLPGDRSSGSESSPKRRGAVKNFGHSRNSSGAESVSYVTETDEDGAKRWVLEKRRMAEGGQMEIMDRHFVGRV
ncbi:hypothetical protein MMC30_006401 [Trapelia coarctata]|nr:hypothetical protein [Trapelia coarctata]